MALHSTHFSSVRSSLGYAWTALGQMSQASVSGEAARDYTYDAFGRRVKTVVGAVETEMLYHGWHMIGAFEKKLGCSDEWLWQEVPMSRGEGMLEHVALDTSEYLSYAVHEDWQNTVWALSNTSAVVVERYEQDDPFGKSHTLDAIGNDLGSFASQVYHHKRMHGGVVEPVTGLYDFRNRWYSPESGSWLSRDPLGYVDSENLYQAMMGNANIITDRYGLACPPGSNELFSQDSFTLCFDGDADGEGFVGDCENKPGCSEIYYEHSPPAPPTSTVTIKIDPSMVGSMSNGISLFFHEVVHAEVVRNCHALCSQKYASSSNWEDFVCCMDGCRLKSAFWPPWENEESRACRVQGEIYDMLISIRQGEL